MPRPGRNGVRPPRIKSLRTDSPGQIEDALQVWVNIGPHIYQLFLHDETAQWQGTDGTLRPMSTELGPNVHLLVPDKRLTIDLTYMTAEEHAAFRKFINMALDLSEPVVLMRDKEAQDAFDSGDDSFHRLHRAVPNLVVRPRAQRAYSEIVRLGLEDVLGRGWTYLRERIGTGGVRDEVADGAPPDAGTPDDAASPDQPPSVQPVGGTGADVSGLQGPNSPEAHSGPVARGHEWRPSDDRHLT